MVAKNKFTKKEWQVIIWSAMGGYILNDITN